MPPPRPEGPFPPPPLPGFGLLLPLRLRASSIFWCTSSLSSGLILHEPTRFSFFCGGYCFTGGGGGAKEPSDDCESAGGGCIGPGADWSRRGGGKAMQTSARKPPAIRVLVRRSPVLCF